jgi:glycosyltransferase involved in cell wall biosynthesis
MYFTDADSFSRRLDELLANPVALTNLRLQARTRFNEAFTWPYVLEQYEILLTQYLPT